jgi:hypothetical protein
MKKRILGSFLAIVMVLSTSFLFLQASALSDSNSETKYQDISAHWSKNAVVQLLQKDAIPYDEGQLLPDKGIKRFEFAIMLRDALDIEINYLKEPIIKDYYDDIEQNAPYTSAVIDLVTANVFEGKGSFQPEEGLTKEKMLHYIMQAYQFIMPDDAQSIKIGAAAFLDADKITPEYSGEIARAQYYGLIIGNGNNMFQPQKTATRAETIVVISRLLTLLETKSQQIIVEPKVVLNSDSLEMILTIQNNTPNDSSIMHTSGQKFDFELLDAERKSLYRWSVDKSFIMALTTTKIEAGKTLTFSETLSGEAYQKIKDKIVYLKAYITGDATFINTEGYEIKIK